MSNTVNDSGTVVYFRAETVPARNQAKRDARAFERWYDEASPLWPDDLKRLGRFGVLALKSLDQPNVPELLVREAAKDMKAFMEAYGAWRIANP